MLSPGSLFSVPVCCHPCVALAAACLPTVNGHVAASPAGLAERGLLGRHRGSPQGQGGSWGAAVSGVGSLARGWPSLSPRKPSDKPATWSLLPKTQVAVGSLAHRRPPCAVSEEIFCPTVGMHISQRGGGCCYHFVYLLNFFRAFLLWLFLSFLHSLSLLIAVFRLALPISLSPCPLFLLLILVSPTRVSNFWENDSST